MLIGLPLSRSKQPKPILRKSLGISPLHAVSHTPNFCSIAPFDNDDKVDDDDDDDDDENTC